MFPYYPYAGYEDSVEGAGLPVYISEDGNTVTITGYTVNFEDEEGNVTPVEFYPNVMYESATNGGLVFYNSHVVSDVTLTRGWNAPAPAKASVKSSVKSGKVVTPKNAVEHKAPKRPYSTTPLVPQQPKVEAKVVKNKQVTPAETRQGMEKLMKKLQPAVRK